MGTAVYGASIPDLLSPFRARFGDRWEEHGELPSVVLRSGATLFGPHRLADRSPNAWATSLFKDAPSCRTGLSAEGTSAGRRWNWVEGFRGLEQAITEMMGLSRDNGVTVKPQSWRYQGRYATSGAWLRWSAVWGPIPTTESRCKGYLWRSIG